jgi:hypothetical protein
MSQEALAKVVEVSTSDTFIISWNDGAPQSETINPSQTLFPNILALIADISDQMTGWAYLTTGYKVGTNNGSGSAGATTITGTLASTLGFTGSETPSSDYITSTYTPEELWLPTNHSSDGQWFRSSAAEKFKGSIGTDGNRSGISYAARDKRPAEWPVEHAYNAIEKADPTKATTAADRLARTARCFRKVLDDARAMSLSESGSGNKNCKGVYLICDLDDYVGEGAGGVSNYLPETWDSGDVEYDSAGALSNYIFCSIGPPRIPGESDQRTRSLYTCTVELTTAIAPTWGWDIS